MGSVPRLTNLPGAPEIISAIIVWVERLHRFLSSSIGRKVVMSLTGLALIGFLVSHLAGNLLLFAGEGRFNEYAHMLVSNPAIYLAEAGLLGIFLIHLLNAAMLTLDNTGARGQRYIARGQAGGPSRKSPFSSLMIFSGLVILVFVPLHIWTFKYGAYYKVADKPGMRDLHRLVVEVFKDPLQVWFYVFALLVLGCHLWHGFGSAFESLGLPYRNGLRLGCQLLSVLLTAGFMAIPLVIKFKWPAQ